jgi:tetratricopeptide (TPR) repeat protein
MLRTAKEMFARQENVHSAFLCDVQICLACLALDDFDELFNLTSHISQRDDLRQAMKDTPIDAMHMALLDLHEGVACMKAERLDDALALLRHALHHFDSVDSVHAAAAAHNIGTILNIKSLFSQSLEYHTKALAHYNAVKDSFGASLVRDNLGFALAKLGQLTKASESFSHALKHWSEIDEPTRSCETLERLAAVKAALGEFKPAAQCYLQALTLAQTHCPDSISRLRVKMDNLAERAEQVDQALSVAVEPLVSKTPDSIHPSMKRTPPSTATPRVR